MRDSSKSIVIDASGVEKNGKRKWRKGDITKNHSDGIHGKKRPPTKVSSITDLLTQLPPLILVLDSYGVAVELSCSVEVLNGFLDRSRWPPVVRP